MNYADIMDSWLVQPLLVCALCVFLAGVLIPQILLVSFRRRLFDMPDERKIHVGAVPRLGGIAFTPVVCFSLSLMLGFGYMFGSEIVGDKMAINAQPVAFGFCALLLLYIVGMADDLIGVRYRAKFVIQLVCAVLLVLGGLACVDLHGVLGLYDIPVWFGTILTIIMVVYVVNAINLIDGIDGLASGLSGAAFLIYGISFGLIERPIYSMLSFGCLGVLIPFFYYNVFGDPSRGKKIFMGDTGSLTIGLFLSFLGLAYLEYSRGEDLPIFGTNPMIVAISPLIIPCFDVVRVFMHRIRNHGNPFLPDKTHIHHKLLALGLRQRVAMVIIVLSAVFFSVFNILLSRIIEINILLIIDLSVWIAANYWLSHAIAKKKKIKKTK